MGAHATMNAGASNANKDTQVPACPSGIYRIISQLKSFVGCDEGWSMIEVGRSRLFLLQSEHILLASNFSRFLIVCWFWAARSAAGLGGRLDISAVADRQTCGQM
jgi:hypothetical protein